MQNPFEIIDARLSNIESMLIDLKREMLPYAEIPKTNIDKSRLSVRANNVLEHAKIYTIEELIKHNEKSLMRFKDMGKKSVKEVREYLSELGITLKR